MCTDPDLTIAKGSISITKKFDKEGTFSFGPFTFEIEGKLYKSGSASVTVYPELPKVRKGVWINYIKSGDDYFLIIEQRIEGNNQNLFSTPESRMLEKDTVFVRVDDSLTTKDSDIIFMTHGSSLQMKSLENGMNKTDFQYTQKTTIYKVWTSGKYDNNFSLSKEHLLNLPANSDFVPILMKK